jgi:lipoyl(octanoyl) transferase
VDERAEFSAEWLWVQSGASAPAFNMAMDEGILEIINQLGRPVLRFYGWTEPAASFGYFQHYSEVERLTSLRPLVRRPTGGGIVPHDCDWTYSLAFPIDHEWYSVSATESYWRVHRWLQLGFQQLGVNTQLAPAAHKKAPGQCFAGHEQSDLLWHGTKIAGAAQRRRKDGLLIQGSVQPPKGPFQRGDWEVAMLKVYSSTRAIRWQPYLPDSNLQERTARLSQSKYAQESYNQRR